MTINLKEKYLLDDDLLTFIKTGGREIDINFYHKKFTNSEEIAYVKWFIPKKFDLQNYRHFQWQKITRVN